jgi:hypothetical protein
MNTETAVVVIVALLVVGAVVAFLWKQRRTHDLRSRFGPEYDRAIDERGGRGHAEAELRRREKRVDRLPIRPWPADRRARYTEEWNEQQARFVDEPRRAVIEADHLIEDVMKERGYPMTDFDQRAADISVDHPQVVNNYRTAHDIAVRQERGDTNTEDLRRAMICYRDLFRELVEDDMVPAGVRR